MKRGPQVLVGLAALLGLALVVVLGVLLANPPWDHEPVPKVVRELDGLSGTPLAEEKLRQETLKLELENRSHSSRWSLFTSYVPFITAVVGGAGIIATLWKQLDDRAAQLEKDRQLRLDGETERRDQLEKDRAQREIDGQRRFDEVFTKIVTNLGSDSPSLQASAVVSLPSFLNEQYDRNLHRQVYDVVRGNLKIKFEELAQNPTKLARDTVADLLVAVLEQALRILLPKATDVERPYLLDLSCSVLARVDLTDLDLSEADVAFSDLHDAVLAGAKLVRARGIEANLEGARLTNAILREARFRRVRGNEANFRKATLTSVDLRQAQLDGAQFQGALLQSGHLDGATLRGAAFEDANLSDAYFIEAVFDEPTLRSIATGARNWEKAHFDAAVTDRLAEIRRSQH